MQSWQESMATPHVILYLGSSTVASKYRLRPSEKRDKGWLSQNLGIRMASCALRLQHFMLRHPPESAVLQSFVRSKKRKA